MRIIINTIHHLHQRYDTCGDWQITEGAFGPEISITVSDTGDEREAFLLAVHELIEAGLCYFAGVTSQQVDDFDMNWEPHDEISEPGDDEMAPYYHQHHFAEDIEMQVSEALNINWEEYEAHVDALEWHTS